VTNSHDHQQRSFDNALAKLVLLREARHASDRKAAREQIAQEAQVKLLEQDIRRVHDELVVANCALAAVNADLETFSYSVAHDLRAPLRQIVGFSRILLDDYAASLPAGARTYLDKMVQGVQVLDTLVTDLLHLAQVDRQPLSLQVTPLNLLVSAAMETLEPEYAGRDVDWRVLELFSVACDPGLMKQVFVNLIGNALKYSRNSTPPVIEIGQARMRDEQVVYIRDNGVGFDMKSAGKLFGVLQRLHAAGEFPGSGVGLATVERIIRRHHGTIWAQAEPGIGATFFFTVPATALAIVNSNGKR